MIYTAYYRALISQLLFYNPCILQNSTVYHNLMVKLNDEKILEKALHFIDSDSTRHIHRGDVGENTRSIKTLRWGDAQQAS